MHGVISYTSPDQLPIPIGDTTGAIAIAHWLGNDIQYSVASIDLWLTLFNDVSNGDKNDGYQGTGNAFSVYMTGTTILLESEYVESHRVCLSLEQVSSALEQYRLFLCSDYKSPEFQTVPFVVQFLAEESDAAEYYSQNGGVLG